MKKDLPLLFILLTFLIGQSINANSQTIVKSTPMLSIAVPDTNFKKALIAHDINHGTSYNISDDGPGYVNVPDISIIKELKLSPLDTSKIRKLTGIEDFTALENLVCDNNKIDTLDLSQNTKLITVDCHSNVLKYLDVTGCPDLEEITASMNQLQSVNVNSNLKLKLLYLTINDLEQLDISQNLNLETLYVNFNDLDTLDISQNVKLKDVDCSNNSLDTLDISNNPLLTRLGCAYLALDTIDISHLSNLDVFFCYGNNLQNIDLSSNTMLSNFNCNGNQLSSLDLTANMLLTDLQCQYNDIKTLDVSNNSSLNNLDFRQNNGSNDEDMDTLFVMKDQVFSTLQIDETTVIDTLGVSSVVVEHNKTTQPQVFDLDQNYPNPFNPATTIKVHLKSRVYATLKVYDVLGREVQTLLQGTYNPGVYHVSFNARGLSSGLYLYQLQIEHEKMMTRSMLLLK